MHKRGLEGTNDGELQAFVVLDDKARGTGMKNDWDLWGLSRLHQNADEHNVGFTINIDHSSWMGETKPTNINRNGKLTCTNGD